MITLVNAANLECTLSLGGALASLLSFQLADREDLKLPITCISFAAPMVGNASYQKTFLALEQVGRLRHVRVTNELDVIPLSPPWSGYGQTGVNLHLQSDGSYELSFSQKLKSWGSQLRPSSLAAHSLVTHWERGQTAQEQYLNHRDGASDTVEELYEKFLPTAATSVE